MDLGLKGRGYEHAVRRGRQTAKMANLARRLGPGLITGVSDDDPSGNATYA
jgi:Mn2+/Fe2+ NRAMP family transporter